jgi:hypothetical protein
MESAMVRLEQCFQQQDESPRDFADRFLRCVVKADRQEDPSLLYSFTLCLLPELREEVMRQRLHSLADVVAFCDYWLTLPCLEDSYGAWQQGDGCSPDTSSWDLLFDNDPDVYGQDEYESCRPDSTAWDLHLDDGPPPNGQQTSPAPSDGDVCVDLHPFEASMGHSLDQLIHMRERLQTKDLEIAALKALLQRASLAHDLGCCGPHQAQSASSYAAVAAADDAVQLLTAAPCHCTSSAPSQSLSTPHHCHSSGRLVCEPPFGHDTCPPQVDLLPEDTHTYNLKKPAYYVYDPPKAVSGGQQLPKWYYGMLSVDALLGAAYPWLQEAAPTSATSAADIMISRHVITPWLLTPPKPRSASQQCQHLRHMLAWSKVPKDPGKCCDWPGSSGKAWDRPDWEGEGDSFHS